MPRQVLVETNAFELMKAMIEAGAAGVHFEDQLSSAKNVDTLVVKY
jgi:isocitrate lyase